MTMNDKGLDCKSDFPVFNQHPELVYLDSTATTQKPQVVIDEMQLFIANDNADGQVVLSGLKENIENSLHIFKENGARKAMQLAVSAPFHCPLMRPAQEIMEKSLSSIKVQKPDVPVISNVTVDISEDENQIKNNLVNQVTEMVRWRETMTKFVDMGVEELYEIGSGSVLSNLAKRSCPSFKRMSAGSKESVENLLLEFDS